MYQKIGLVLLVFLIFIVLVVFYRSRQPAGESSSETKKKTEVSISPSTGPRMEKLPWENSTCGNGVCELCESSDSCCNYPPTKDKNGTMVYPPPTCMGQCAKDCTAPFPLEDSSARYYIENNYLRYQSKDDPSHPIGIGISNDTTISFKEFEGKDIVVKGEFIVQTQQVQCIKAPCPPLEFKVIRLDSVRLK